MGTLEVVVLILGAAIFTVSFLIPQKVEGMSDENQKLVKEEIKKIVSQEMERSKGHVEDVVEESITYAVEKTERSLERLTNEKIMAVNEYSDTVLKEIHKNHEEAMFLYDMLNNKHDSLKNTVSEVNKIVKQAEEKAREAEAVVNTFEKLTPGNKVNVVSEANAVNTQVNQLTEEDISARAGKQSDISEEGTALKVETDAAFEDITDEQGSNNNEKILELHQRGWSLVDIAKELELGVGEVKLVVDLFRNV